MTARCLTFPHCPGLRRAEQFFFFFFPLSLKSSSWHHIHMWMQEVEPKVINTASSIVGRSPGSGQGSRCVVGVTNLVPGQ